MFFTWKAEQLKLARLLNMVFGYTKLNFGVYVDKSIQKAEKSLTARLMPNIGGPGAIKRRVFSGVMHSQLLHGEPS